jgi:hypothetical protein
LLPIMSAHFACDPIHIESDRRPPASSPPN